MGVGLVARDPALLHRAALRLDDDTAAVVVPAGLAAGEGQPLDERVGMRQVEDAHAGHLVALQPRHPVAVDAAQGDRLAEPDLAGHGIRSVRDQHRDSGDRPLDGVMDVRRRLGPGVVGLLRLAVLLDDVDRLGRDVDGVRAHRDESGLAHRIVDRQADVVVARNVVRPLQAGEPGAGVDRRAGLVVEHPGVVEQVRGRGEAVDPRRDRHIRREQRLAGRGGDADAHAARVVLVGTHVDGRPADARIAREVQGAQAGDRDAAGDAERIRQQPVVLRLGIHEFRIRGDAARADIDGRADVLPSRRRVAPPVGRAAAGVVGRIVADDDAVLHDRGIGAVDASGVRATVADDCAVA